MVALELCRFKFFPARLTKRITNSRFSHFNFSIEGNKHEGLSKPYRVDRHVRYFPIQPIVSPVSDIGRIAFETRNTHTAVRMRGARRHYLGIVIVSFCVGRVIDGYDPRTGIRHPQRSDDIVMPAAAMAALFTVVTDGGIRPVAKNHIAATSIGGVETNIICYCRCGCHQSCKQPRQCETFHEWHSRAPIRYRRDYTAGPSAHHAFVGRTLRALAVSLQNRDEVIKKAMMNGIRYYAMMAAAVGAAFAPPASASQATSPVRQTPVLMDNVQPRIKVQKLLPPAPCVAVAASLGGRAFRAGSQPMIDLIDRKAAGGRAVYRPGATDIELPKGGTLGVSSWAIPKVERISLAYQTIELPSEPGMVPGGWFRGPTIVTQIGDFTDHQDGTITVRLPHVRGGTHLSPGLLTIQTNVCTVTANVDVAPHTHIGRWFPPAIMTICASRPSAAEFPQYEAADVGTAHFFDALAKINGSDRKMQQYCSTYGAVHEGGIAVGNARGYDEIIVWTGSSNSDVKVLSNCQVSVSRQEVAVQSYVTGGRPRSRIAKTLSDRAMRVGINWKITEPHGYCYYAIVVRGNHDQTFSEERTSLSAVSRDTSGVEYRFRHLQDRSDLLRVVRDESGRRTVETFPLKLSDVVE